MDILKQKLMKKRQSLAEDGGRRWQEGLSGRKSSRNASSDCGRRKNAKPRPKLSVRRNYTYPKKHEALTAASSSTTTPDKNAAKISISELLKRDISKPGRELKRSPAEATAQSTKSNVCKRCRREALHVPIFATDRRAPPIPKPHAQVAAAANPSSSHRVITLQSSKKVAVKFFQIWVLSVLNRFTFCFPVELWPGLGSLEQFCERFFELFQAVL
ncbi:hypothetical protein ACS0TY_011298 [Phlomoides rotata]